MCNPNMEQLAGPVKDKGLEVVPLKSIEKHNDVCGSINKWRVLKFNTTCQLSFSSLTDKVAFRECCYLVQQHWETTVCISPSEQKQEMKIPEWSWSRVIRERYDS